jgi:HSP20 family protein
MTLLEKTPSLMPDVFSGFFDDDRFLNFDFRTTWPSKVPAANVFEHDDDFVIHLAAPGMKKSDFKITMENRTLWISAEREEDVMEEMQDYTRREFNYASFKRSFAIPENVNPDKIGAKYVDGVLMIRLPKLEVVKKLPRKEIKIT